MSPCCLDNNTVSGAMAERATFGAYVVHSFLITTFICEPAPVVPAADSGREEVFLRGHYVAFLASFVAASTDYYSVHAETKTQSVLLLFSRLFFTALSPARCTQCCWYYLPMCLPLQKNKSSSICRYVHTSLSNFIPLFAVLLAGVPTTTHPHPPPPPRQQ